MTKVLAVIPARAGSKGLPGKNLRPLAGKSLMERAIDAARAAGTVTNIVVTSDSHEVLAVAARHECAVIDRRPELATDTASSIDVLLDAIAQSPPADVVVLLQPTSPLRTATDIEETVRPVAQGGAPACVSVSEVTEHPQWMFFREGSGALVPVTGSWDLGGRRQDLRPAFVLNGAVYAARTDWLQRHHTFITTETVAYVMPASRAIDIDTLRDFERAEQLLKES